MNSFLDPNVGYALLVGGILLSILALFVPGTGLLELGAFAALFVAGYMVVNLPFNLWALILMAVSIIPLVIAIRWRKGGTILLVGSIAVLFVGSIFVFRAENGGPAVNPLVALLVSGGSAWLIWFVSRKTLESFSLKIRHDQDRVVGMEGVARTDLRLEGSVYVNGENWSAHSEIYIPKGSPVRVIKRSGLVLDVEKIRTEE